MATTGESSAILASGVPATQVQKPLSQRLARALLYLLLVACSLWFIAPLIWMLMTSFMPLSQVGIFPARVDPAHLAA